MVYYPDPARYQQLGNGDPYGYADCTAWSAAYGCDAHTTGTIKTTGTAVRRHSNEPVPKSTSPGLNLTQVDESLLEITHNKVDLDTHTGMDIDVAQRRIMDGRYALVQVNRGVLVRAGYGGANGFTGGHCEVASFRTGEPVLFDPLLKRVQRLNGWNVLWRAAGALVTGMGGNVVGYGRANVAFTRDLTPDWLARIHAGAVFTRFLLGGDLVVDSTQREKTPNGFSATSSPPYYVKWPGHGSVKVVKLTSGVRQGWVIRSKWADQVG